MVKFFLIKNLSLLALLVVLSTHGCAGPSPYIVYSGEKRRKTDISIINGSLAFVGLGDCSVSIADINSQGLKPFPQVSQKYDVIAVLPGFYTVKVYFGCGDFMYWTTTLRPAQIGFNVEAGHEYEITGHWWKVPPDLFVGDKNSGEQVAAEIVLPK